MLPLPDKESPEFRFTPGKHLLRDLESQNKSWEQACRQRWRALALVIKAKLEAVECGISTIEREFLANVVMPDGSTVGDVIEEQIANAYLTGKMPPLLEAPKAEKLLRVE